ncbi:MAG: hypothetical protein JNN00_14460 [Chitinophagaceae bacterium]|nr:hypothetical protein [Chitinophagaceae bacterium]
MKNKAGFWTIIGMATGTAIAIVSKNIPAGLFIGAGTGMLLLIITNLETDKKIQN